MDAWERDLFLSLGSNLGDREANLRGALTLLREHVHVAVVSSLYETDPVGGVDQPDFLNLTVAAVSRNDPLHLLASLKAIEREMGRQPTVRWGPRVVDLDILLYGELVLETPELTIPHREMTRRAFVLVPLAEIAPDAVHPTSGLTVRELAAGVPGSESVRRAGRLLA